MPRAVWARPFQSIAGGVVVGLSASLITQQYVGAVPAVISFTTFCGGFAIFASIVGVTSNYIESIEGIITWAIDGLAALLLLAAGIALAVQLGSTSCGSILDDARRGRKDPNPLLTGGCHLKEAAESWGCYNNAFKDEKKGEALIMGRCQRVQADSAFAFIAFIACVAAAALSFLSVRRTKY
ncbi:hypothetical protein P152DRAFT_459896 [Eremomyces bilateralis CBS 781.70]|uniref:MARVEL domain-containing protein n=1 Tax=Eremomyces bilateralis CBS 781.70 TaxID=1392243 RepID=A0A6G1FYS9_9PEZI|nr:uncharacterized protein P152DRAFT_459896 [Eremomyces bilateralis CBS 781.70]KAF1811025.1 hypothetical protein P152DRAFT_459896 [Eremomyces bilateralis CBS 781.70]